MDHETVSSLEIIAHLAIFLVDGTRDLCVPKGFVGPLHCQERGASVSPYDCLGGIVAEAVRVVLEGLQVRLRTGVIINAQARVSNY